MSGAEASTTGQFHSAAHPIRTGCCILGEDASWSCAVFAHLCAAIHIDHRIRKSVGAASFQLRFRAAQFPESLGRRRFQKEILLSPGRLRENKDRPHMANLWTLLQGHLGVQESLQLSEAKAIP